MIEGRKGMIVILVRTFVYSECPRPFWDEILCSILICEFAKDVTSSNVWFANIVLMYISDFFDMIWELIMVMSTRTSCNSDKKYG